MALDGWLQPVKNVSVTSCNADELAEKAIYHRMPDKVRSYDNKRTTLYAWLSRVCRFLLGLGSRTLSDLASDSCRFVGSFVRSPLEPTVRVPYFPFLRHEVTYECLAEQTRKRMKTKNKASSGGEQNEQRTLNE